MAGRIKYLTLQLIAILLSIHLEWSYTNAQTAANDTLDIMNETLTNSISTSTTNIPNDVHVKESITNSSTAALTSVESTSTASTTTIMTPTLTSTESTIITAAVTSLNLTTTQTVTESIDLSNISTTESHRNSNDSSSLGKLEQPKNATNEVTTEKPEVNKTNIVLHNALNISAINLNEQKSSGNCTGFPLLDQAYQPVYSPEARIKKCCPVGENFQISEMTGTHQCIKESTKFEVPVIDAVFYQHCIEDTERPITMEYKFGTPCEDTLMYNEFYGDLLYVLQNGSLLRVSQDFSSYDVSNDYCLDMHEDKVLTAFVCPEQSEVRVSKAEAYLYATCKYLRLLVSVPCLFVTVFFYIHIDELRNLHGKSLACHSLCLAIAFLLISVSQIQNRVPQSVGYCIQYFLLACFCWVAVMCADLCIHVWWHLPKYKNITQKVKTIRFIVYSLVSFGVPFILVLMAISAQEPGQSSYYLKGVKEDSRTPLNYFIPPISSILFICFGLLVGAYFGFRNLLNLEAKAYIMQKSFEDGASFYNTADINFKVHIDDVERTARSTAYLYLIMTINWIFEIISFYTHAPSSSSLVLFDVLNALQGVVIFIIFLCLPRPKMIITRWWKSQGSLECNNTEMEVLNNHNYNKE